MKNVNTEKIQNMFNKLAPDYDFMNGVISFGLQKIIKKNSLSLIQIQPSSVIVDLCCGTGDITQYFATDKNVKKVYGIDFSQNMLKIATRKNKSNKIEFLLSECSCLPFENESIDGCSLGFGLRNIQNREKVLTEIVRVLKNGGFFFHLDIFRGNKVINSIFDNFVYFAAKLLGKSPKSYKYLIDSKNMFLSPEKLIESVEQPGFKCIKLKRYAFGMISAQLFIKEHSQQE